MHPQTLRKYERAGFVEPPRTGSLRLYTEEDIVRLRLIKHFVEDLGLNLAGVQLALNLATKLLSIRGFQASQPNAPSALKEVLREVDDILEKDLALRVVKGQEPPAAETGQLPEPQPTSFYVRRGEAVQYAVAPDNNQ